MFKAAEGGELPLLASIQPEGASNNWVPDYAEDAIQLRRIFRELSEPSRRIALELLKALARTQ